MKAIAKRAAPAARQRSARGTRGPRTYKHVAVRLDEEVVARLDALVPALESGWRKIRRSDVLRKVILSGLHELERDLKRFTGRARKGAAPSPLLGQEDHSKAVRARASKPRRGEA